MNAPLSRPVPSGTGSNATVSAAAGAVDASKIYGVGDAEVKALDDVTI